MHTCTLKYNTLIYTAQKYVHMKLKVQVFRYTVSASRQDLLTWHSDSNLVALVTCRSHTPRCANFKPKSSWGHYSAFTCPEGTCHRSPQTTCAHNFIYKIWCNLHIWVKIPWNACIHVCTLKYGCTLMYLGIYSFTLRCVWCIHSYISLSLYIPSHDLFIIIIIMNIIQVFHHVNHLSMVLPSGNFP